MFDDMGHITGYKELKAFMRCRGPIDEGKCKIWITQKMAEEPPLAGALKKSDCLGPCRWEDTFEIDYEDV